MVTRLKGLLFIGVATILTGFNINKVQAAITSDATGQAYHSDDMDHAFGGMSAILNDYYDSILSEYGVSIDNVSTTLSIDGEPIEKVNRVSAMFLKIAFADVIDYVNIRSEASTDSDCVGRLYSKAAVTVTGTDGEWTKVVSGTIEGYIKSEYLMFGLEAEEFAKENYTRYAQVTCANLEVKSDAGENYKSIGSVAYGSKLEVVDEFEDWVKVKYDSTTGYVSKNYVDYTYDFKGATTLEEARILDEQRKYDVNYMIWPLPSDHSICTYFGYRVAPIKGASTFHQGLDIGGTKGAKVVAVLSGTVTAATYSSSGGYYVEIDHGNGYKTRYLHNSKLLVTKGQKVTQGEVISLVGSTGVSTAPHLHFSIVKNGTMVDPYPYLKKVH